VDKDIKKSISATDKDAQYDEKAKNLLGHKIILAHILVKTIDEFKGMNPKDVVQYIEGEPYISTVPVDAGSTNVEKEQNGEKVIGLNTENSELNEGIAETIVKMYRKGYEAEQISDILDMEVEEVRKIIENE
jgi:hypothetical protein